MRHYSTDGKIGFDSFVACCVKLRVLTSKLACILLSLNSTQCVCKLDQVLVSM